MVQKPCILECIYISRDMASVSLCLYLSVLCHCLSLSFSLLWDSFVQPKQTCNLLRGPAHYSDSAFIVLLHCYGAEIL